MLLAVLAQAWLGLAVAIAGTCCSLYVVFRRQKGLPSKAVLRIYTDEMQIWKDGELIWFRSWGEEIYAAFAADGSISLFISAGEPTEQVFLVRKKESRILRSAWRVLVQGVEPISLEPPLRRIGLRAAVAVISGGLSAIALALYVHDPLKPWSIATAFASILLLCYPVMFLMTALPQIGFADRQRTENLVRAGHCVNDILPVLPIMDFERLVYRYAHPQGMLNTARRARLCAWMGRVLFVAGILAVIYLPLGASMPLFILAVLPAVMGFELSNYTQSRVMLGRNKRLEVRDRQLFWGEGEERLRVEVMPPRFNWMASAACTLTDGTRRWQIRPDLLIEDAALAQAEDRFEEAVQQLESGEWEKKLGR